MAAADQVAEGWTREQKDKCLDETEKAFAVRGMLLCLLWQQCQFVHAL